MACTAASSASPKSSNANCAPPYPNNGKAVIDCVERKYPQYLVAHVSVDRRKANMAFLRDRIIEIGICGGMNLAWNMKRGGPEKSIDFLAWHDGRQWIGVDIGRAYDATNRKLDLVWGIYGPTPHARRSGTSSAPKRPRWPASRRWRRPRGHRRGRTPSPSSGAWTRAMSVNPIIALRGD